MEHGDGHTQGMGHCGSPDGDTHWELGMAGPVAHGLLSLVGVVVKGCAEEAGLHLVTLPAHEVGAAGTGPILHGAPGEWPSSIFLSDCASPIPSCPQPSTSRHRDPSFHTTLSPL